MSRPDQDHRNYIGEPEEKEKGPRHVAVPEAPSLYWHSKNRTSANHCQAFWRRFGERIFFA
jgi:hypothetical protein